VLMFSNPIVGGTTLIREAIRSPNYVAGVSGWSINRDGSVEFSSGTFRGDLHIGTATNYVEILNSSPYSVRIVKTGSPGAADVSLQVSASGGFGGGGWALGSTSAPQVRYVGSGDVLPNRGNALYLGSSGGNDSVVITPTNVYCGVSGGTVNFGGGGGFGLSETFNANFRGTVNVVAGDLVRDAYFGSGPTFGAAAFYANWNTRGFTELSGIISNGTFWSWRNSTGSWDTGAFVASNISGGAAVMTWRTNPLASQARVGTSIQDVYWRNSVDSGYIGHQAANFTVGSREATTAPLVPVAELHHSVLEDMRKLRPIRFRQKGMDEGRLSDPADTLHTLHPNLRALGPAGAMRKLSDVWEASITHYGFTVEDVHALFPDACTLGDDGEPVGYSVNGLLALTIKALHELAERVDSLPGGKK
jgi:hypothetical protein